mgnify:CR=1 FL=1
MTDDSSLGRKAPDAPVEPPAPSVDMWRPIDENTPRDGTGILAYNPMAGVYSTAFTTRWTGDPGEHAAGTYEGFPCGFWSGGLGSYPFGKWDCVPTHWMPKPPQPQD